MSWAITPPLANTSSSSTTTPPSTTWPTGSRPSWLTTCTRTTPATPFWARPSTRRSRASCLDLRSSAAMCCAAMDTITLSYFDAPTSRGEECRLALTLAGVDFHDDRIKSADWPARKAQTPFGSIPVLTVGGRQLAQSNAILRYVAREYGLESKDPWQRAQEDAVLESVEEKKAARRALAEGPIPRWGASVEALIQGPFFSGETIRVADLKLFMIVTWVSTGVIDHLPVNLLADCPKLVRLHAAVGEHPQVKAFRARYAAK